MSTERETLLFMAQIFDQTERTEDMIETMKKVVELNPDLNPDERNLLSVAYKNLVSKHRNSIRNIAAIIEHEEGRHETVRVQKLEEYKAVIVGELEATCKELIALVDEKLLPAVKELDKPIPKPAPGVKLTEEEQHQAHEQRLLAEKRVFYIKMKADYYRYITESLTGEEKEKISALALKAYKDAIEIAEAYIPMTRPTYLGLILNYSVFLYEIIGQKQEAKKLAFDTYNKAHSADVGANSEMDDSSSSGSSFSEATQIVQLLRDNYSLWEQESPAN